MPSTPGMVSPASLGSEKAWGDGGNNGGSTSRAGQFAAAGKPQATKGGKDRRDRNDRQSDRSLAERIFSRTPRERTFSVGTRCWQDAQVFHQDYSGRYCHSATLSLRSRARPDHLPSSLALRLRNALCLLRMEGGHQYFRLLARSRQSLFRTETMLRASVPPTSGSQHLKETGGGDGDPVVFRPSDGCNAGVCRKKTRERRPAIAGERRSNSSTPCDKPSLKESPSPPVSRA